jgi:hypothetical protein
MSGWFKCARHGCPCWQSYQEANQSGSGSYCSLACADDPSGDKPEVEMLAPIKTMRFFAREPTPLWELQMGAGEGNELYQAV